MVDPSWIELHTLASAQDGYFTTAQANSCGYTRPLLTYHVGTGRFLHVQRGIYRLRDHPASDHEDVVVAWLWSGQEGVVSHETALQLHGLSDALPALVDLAVPTSWSRRRIAIPPLVNLHYGDVPADERTWIGATPVTRPLRTIFDCVQDHVQPDLIAQAVADGLQRGLFTRRDLEVLGVPLET